jgi:glycosyltransferase involved in cell wall biosynthesis
MRTLAVSLLTLGDPRTTTGGYLYHRRVAEFAPANGARVRFVSVPDHAFPLPALAGRGVLREAQRPPADVLLLDSIAAAFVGPWLVRATLRVPLVGMLHQPPGGIDHGPVRAHVQAALDRLAYRPAARLVAASAALGDQLRAAGYPQRLLRVVPPGRDVAAGLPAAGHPAGEAPAGLPGPADLRRGRRAAVLSVGNWVARKGLLDLLEAVAGLPAGAVTLHLVGETGADPAYARRVRARLAAADLAGRVVVHGRLPVQRVAAMYRAADAFALASLVEPYGTVYGEAMAAGLPVVGWRAGNLPHLARHGVEGLVVPPGDVAGLTAALRRLAADEPLRHRLAAAAARRAATFPTWQETAERLFAELRAVLAESAADPRPDWIRWPRREGRRSRESAADHPLRRSHTLSTVSRGFVRAARLPRDVSPSSGYRGMRWPRPHVE